MASRVSISSCRRTLSRSVNFRFFRFFRRDAISLSYSWDRGATLASGASYGNSIANQRSLTINGKLNFETRSMSMPTENGSS